MKVERPRLPSLDDGKASRLRTFGQGYSWFVKIAKFAMPVAALVIIGIVVANLQENPVQQQIAELPKDEKTVPGQIELVQAKYQGTDEKGQAYTLTADRATRANENENVIALEKPKADIVLQQGGWLAVHANTGAFDNAAAKLDLSGDVIIFHDAGYELKMQDAHVDLTARTAHSTQPVEGHGPLGDIRAQNLAIADGGTKIIFGGPATLTLRLGKGKVPG